jgi:hypothetical protein
VLDEAQFTLPLFINMCIPSKTNMTTDTVLHVMRKTFSNDQNITAINVPYRAPIVGILRKMHLIVFVLWES